MVNSRSENGNIFEGTKGRMFINRGRITGNRSKRNRTRAVRTDDLVRLYKGKPFEGHKQNFYRCIREGGLPVSDAFSHVQTMNICHLLRLPRWLGRKIHWDPQAEKIIGDDRPRRLCPAAAAGVRDRE